MEEDEPFDPSPVGIFRVDAVVPYPQSSAQLVDELGRTLGLSDAAVFLARLAGREPPVGYDELRELAPGEQGELFIARLRAVDLLPPETGIDRVRRLLRVYKANVRAALAYAPGPFAGPLTLLRAAEQRPEAEADPTLGWGRLAAEPVTVHTVPGDHLTLLARDNVEVLAQRLGSCL